MWSPTHVQVTVSKARGLINKGKNDTNDAFVTIALGKEKFQTSIKEKASGVIEWHEKCELLIPKQGNKAEIILTALHHNRMAVDEFLGRVNVPLAEMDVYQRPKNIWYKLLDKPGKDKNKERGELEVKIAFIVKAGSLSDLSKKEKHKSSLGQLSQAAHSFGGSLISISSLDKRKGLKKLATRIGLKKKKKDELSPSPVSSRLSSQSVEEADPGVISEAESDDDFMLDDLSHKSSGGSLNISTSKLKSMENLPKIIPDVPTTPPFKPPRSLFSVTPVEPIIEKEKEKQPEPKKIIEEKKQEIIKRPAIQLSKPKILVDKPKRNSKEYEGPLERIIIGKETTRTSSPVYNLPSDVVKQYYDKNKEDLLHIIVDLQNRLTKETKQKKELEDYLDQLLLRVMETSPRILQNPYVKRTN